MLYELKTSLKRYRNDPVSLFFTDKILQSATYWYQIHILQKVYQLITHVLQKKILLFLLEIRWKGHIILHRSRQLSCFNTVNLWFAYIIRIIITRGDFHRISIMRNDSKTHRRVCLWSHPAEYWWITYINPPPIIDKTKLECEHNAITHDANSLSWAEIRECSECQYGVIDDVIITKIIVTYHLPNLNYLPISQPSKMAIKCALGCMILGTEIETECRLP